MDLLTRALAALDRRRTCECSLTKPQQTLQAKVINPLTVRAVFLRQLLQTVQKPCLRHGFWSNRRGQRLGTTPNLRGKSLHNLCAFRKWGGGALSWWYSLRLLSALIELFEA